MPNASSPVKQILSSKETQKPSPKTVFVHNAYAFYRLPLFERLSRYLNIDFLFSEIYGPVKSEPNFNFRILFSFKVPKIKSYYFTPFLPITLIKGKYNLFIGAGIGMINTYLTFLVAKFLRKPFVLWDVSWFMKKTPLRLMRFPIVRYVATHSDAVVIPGLKSESFYLSIGVPRDKIFRSPNVISLKITDNVRSKVRELRNKLGIETGETIVLFFGRIMEVKGIEYLIKAFYRLQKEINARMIIASSLSGEKEYENKMRRLCNDLNLRRVNFLNIEREDEKNACFVLADIFVLPSVFTDDGAETWGMVLNEAMSIGKPVIATNAVGGAYDLIKDGFNGFIVPEKDADALFEAIKKIMLFPELRTKMDKRSREIIRANFTLKNAVEGFTSAVEYVSKSKDHLD